MLFILHTQNIMYIPYSVVYKSKNLKLLMKTETLLRFANQFNIFRFLKCLLDAIMIKQCKNYK